ncbi:MAG: radical SAM protein [Defluviitaleaceae bacterium]|nr:radical SAM protein [Defluviitaleaceae bacterium]
MEWIEAKTIVTGNKSMNYDYLAAEYTMNIYRGCSHGCVYCFARGEYYKIPDFDRVRTKKDALRIIRDDLARKVKKGIVTTGGMSDPYNPQEREHKLTRNALELINAYEFGICILTKSDLAVRDIDILQDIKTHSPVNVSFSITCADDELSRAIEPSAPVSSRRFAAIK